MNLDRPNVHVLALQGDPKSAWDLPTSQVNALRKAMLRPFDIRFQGPARTAFYLFDDRSWVVESFHDAPINVSINGQSVDLEANGWAQFWR